MNDDQSVAPVATDSQNSAQSGQSQKTPLEILEEILGKQKAANAVQAKPAATAPVLPAPARPPATVEPSEAEQAQKLQAIEQEEAVLKVRDDAAAEATLQQIRAAAQDPMYQAVVAKEKTAAADQVQKDNAQAGFEIKQLEHQKI